MSQTPTYNGGNQSSIPDKLPPDLRKKLDDAILNRQPASLARCHKAFQLAAHGVSLPAFYRYARNLRDRIDLEEAAARIQPDDPDVSAFLPQFLGRRLLAILLDDEEASPATLHRLTLAYRAAYNVYMSLDDRKKKTPPPDPETELLRLKTIAMIHEHQDHLQRQMAEREKAAGASTAGARIPSRTDDMRESIPANCDPSVANPKPTPDAAHSEITNLKSAPNNAPQMRESLRPLVRDSHLAPTSAGIPSREPTANPQSTPNATHSEISILKSTPNNTQSVRLSRTNFESRIPSGELLKVLDQRRPTCGKEPTYKNKGNKLRIAELIPARYSETDSLIERLFGGTRPWPSAEIVGLGFNPNHQAAGRTNCVNSTIRPKKSLPFVS